MSKTLLSALALAALVAAGVTSIAPNTAEAGNRHHVRSYGYAHSYVRYVRPVHYAHHVSYVRPVYYAANTCGYSYSRWQDTGSYAWKQRYFDCKGW